MAEEGELVEDGQADVEDAQMAVGQVLPAAGELDDEGERAAGVVEGVAA